MTEAKGLLLHRGLRSKKYMKRQNERSRDKGCR